MAISYVNSGAFTSGTGAITPPLPTGMQAGDLCLLFVNSANQNITITTQGSISWTQLPNSPQSIGTAGAATGVRLAAYYGFYNSGTTAPTIADSGSYTIGMISAFRGVNLTPFDITPLGAIVTAEEYNIFMPNVITITPGSVVINAIADDYDVNANPAQIVTINDTNLTGLTNIINRSVAAGAGGGLVIDYGTKDTVGETISVYNAYRMINKAIMIIPLRPLVDNNKTTTIASTSGFQTALTRTVFKRTTLTNTIGFQNNVALTTTRANSLANTLGVQSVLSAIKQDILIEKTTMLNNSIGYQNSWSVVAKRSNAVASQLGKQETTSIITNKKVALTTILGNQDNLTSATIKRTSVSSSIGLNQIIDKIKRIFITKSSQLGLNNTLIITNNKRIGLNTTLGNQQAPSVMKKTSTSLIDSKGTQTSVSYAILGEALSKSTSISHSIGQTNRLTTLKRSFNTIYSQFGALNSLTSIKYSKGLITATIGFKIGLNGYKQTVRNIANTIGFRLEKTFSKAITINMALSNGFNYQILAFEGTPYRIKQTFYDIGYKDNLLDTQGTDENKMNIQTNIIKQTIKANKHSKLVAIGRLR